MWIDIEDIVDVDMWLAGPPGTGITAAEKVSINNRLTALEAQDIGDLITGTPQDGDTLVYDDATDSWVPGAVAGSLSSVREAGTQKVANATILDFGQMFNVGDNGGGYATVNPEFGTGPNTFAEGSHLHPLPVPERFSLTNPGAIPTISSGTRDLVTANVGPFTVGVQTLVEVEGFVHGEGIIDPAVMDIYIDIDGVRYSSGDIDDTQPLTWEQGVNAQNWWKASAVITRAASGTTAQTAASRQVRLGVSWQGWGGLKVASACMWVKRTAYRT